MKLHQVTQANLKLPKLKRHEHQQAGYECTSTTSSGAQLAKSRLRKMYDVGNKKREVSLEVEQSVSVYVTF